MIGAHGGVAITMGNHSKTGRQAHIKYNPDRAHQRYWQIPLRRQVDDLQAEAMAITLSVTLHQIADATTRWRRDKPAHRSGSVRMESALIK
jgi:hypothetical protein